MITYKFHCATCERLILFTPQAKAPVGGSSPTQRIAHLMSRMGFGARRLFLENAAPDTYYVHCPKGHLNVVTVDPHATDNEPIPVNATAPPHVFAFPLRVEAAAAQPAATPHEHPMHATPHNAHYSERGMTGKRVSMTGLAKWRRGRGER